MLKLYIVLALLVSSCSYVIDTAGLDGVKSAAPRIGPVCGCGGKEVKGADIEKALNKLMKRNNNN